MLLTCCLSIVHAKWSWVLGERAMQVVEESWPMFTLKPERNILFFETNQSPPGADSEIV